MNMQKFAALGVASLAFAGLATPASAQATRTWVSGVGDDVNPCSRTAPCKTFAGAISKTAAGGEIDCLDPGGFGTLTITKSITVDCSGTFGSSLNSGGINGFVINDSATATPGTVDVILRGLSINGAGTTPGLNGIRFISGRSLVVENVIIQNQNSGNGISLQPQQSARVLLNNVTITDSGGGILVQPTGANGTARVELINVRVYNNSVVGLKVDSTGNTATAGIIVSAVRSEFSHSPIGVSAIMPTGTQSVQVMVRDSIIDNNSAFGLAASGTGTAVIRVGGSTITGNGAMVLNSGGGTVRSYGDNQADGNAAASSFSGAVLPTL